MDDSVAQKPVALQYWAAFDAPAWTQAWAAAPSRCGASPELVEVETDWRPWSPFAHPALWHRRPRPYFRHRHLFDGTGLDAHEPLIDEELTYETSTLAQTLLRAMASPGRALVLRHAERLGPEALTLLEQHRQHPVEGLVLVACFEDWPADDGLERLDALGEVTWWGTAPLTSLRGTQRAPSPSAAQRHELLRWLCFKTVATLSNEGAELDRLEALASIGGFEDGVELGEQLVRRLSLAGDTDGLRRLWPSLARLYRQAGDTASAARCLTLGWNRAGDLDNEADAARIDFLLFEASYRNLVVEDVYLGLEERLVARLERLGWRNHLAYVQTKNVWIQTIGRTQGWDRAWALWDRGWALVRATGNQRRRAVALQTQGSLLAIAGRFPEALAASRRSVALARLHSSPLHAAKAENGLGYLAFSAGDDRAAWRHHKAALELLPETRDHQEYVGTLVNLGRLYLLNDQADRALPLLTTAVRAMDGLGLADLPFHPRSNTYALQAACCLKVGQLARAQAFLQKLRVEEARAGRPNEHRLCLEVLVAQAEGRDGDAEKALEAATSFLVPRVRDLRHLLVWVLGEYGLGRAARGLDATDAWDRAESFLLPAPLGADPRARLQACRIGGTRIRRLPPVYWDSPLLIRFSKQEAALRVLRRTVQDYGFLQIWHQSLLPGETVARLFQTATDLLRTHFPLDTVAVLDAEFRVITLAAGSDAALADRVAKGLSQGIASPLPLVEQFPLRHSGLVQARLLCLDTSPEPLFGEGDRRVLALAADHLAVLMLSQRKADDLEERSQHLVRALEILGDTQERLVKSENLAVLGNLAAGLAHELNTPLGAILSSVRTVKSLLLEPLSLAPQVTRWTAGEHEGFQTLGRRIVGREAVLGPVDRSARRSLEKRLTALGAAEAKVQTELWFEVGLGEDSDLQEAWAARTETVVVLERLVAIAQGHRLSRVIEEAAQRAGAVVGTLRSYLQGSAEEGASTFSLQQELESVLAVLGVARWRGVRVVWAVDPSLLLTGRRLALSQVWTNLIQNAVQAMEAKGTLTLGVRPTPKLWIIEVEDDGPGIPEEHRSRVLQPFFSTKKQTGGLGLGLDICRRIVESHGGRLTFESRPGKTVFRVALPREGGAREPH